MIEIKNIQKSYGDFHALKDISLTFRTGETTVMSAHPVRASPPCSAP